MGLVNVLRFTCSEGCCINWSSCRRLPGRPIRQTNSEAALTIPTPEAANTEPAKTVKVKGGRTRDNVEMTISLLPGHGLMGYAKAPGTDGGIDVFFSMELEEVATFGIAEEDDKLVFTIRDTSGSEVRCKHAPIGWHV